MTRPNDQKPHEGWGDEPLRAITKRFILFSQIFFGQMDKGRLRWDTDGDTSEIFISDQKSISQKLLNSKPAILFHRGPVRSADLSFANMRTTAVLDAKKYHTDLIPGTMSANCVAKEGVVAQQVAYAVFFFIRRFLAYFIKGSPIHDIARGVSIGSETEPGVLVGGDSSPNATLVTVTIPFWMQETWSFEDQDVEKLKQMDFILDVQRKNLNTGATQVILEQGFNVDHGDE